MNRISKLSFCLVLLGSLCLMLPGGLRADTFDWSYTGSSATDNASGTLTTGAFTAGVATILSITGTYNGMTITGLLPTGTCCESPANDNLLYFPGPPYLDLGGLGFSVGSLDSNLYLAGGTPGYADLTCDGGATCGGTTSLVSSGSFSVVQTPEPSTLFLLYAGLAGLLGLAWRRQTVQSRRLT